MNHHNAHRERDSVPGVDVRIGNLAALDELSDEIDAVAVFCFSDVRPLRGAAGYIDWRLCGALSRCMESGQFEGRPGETMLVPTSGRFGTRRLFAFGIGAVADWDDGRLRDVARQALEVIDRAGTGGTVLAAPMGGTRDVETEFVRAVAEVAPGRTRHVLVDDGGGREDSPAGG